MAKVISGGELYALRTLPQLQFAASYISTRWPEAGISFGLFDKALATTDVFIPTAANALAACDDLVWVYAEVLDALLAASADVWRSFVQPRPLGKSLIYHGAPGFPAVTTPDILAARPHVKTLPFDGIVVYLRSADFTLNASSAIHTGVPISYDQLMTILAPIRGLDLGNLKRNYALVFGASPPKGVVQLDVLTGDWSTVLQNWANLAKACKDSGLRGIFFDNENYGGTFGRTPTGGDPLRYANAAKIIGHELMLATLDYPGIEVIHTHGPYVSDAVALTALGANPGWAANDLLGPFFVGMLDALQVPVPVPPPSLGGSWTRADIDRLLASLDAVAAALTRSNDIIAGALRKLGSP